MRISILVFLLSLLQVSASAQFTDSGQALGGAGTNSVAVGDLNGDGYPDLVFGNYETGNTVWFNQKDGSFLDSGQSLKTLGRKTNDLALGDINGDGKTDIVEGTTALNPGNFADGANCVLWINDGNGNFSDGGLAGRIMRTEAVALSDVDDDGDLDLIVGNRNNLTIGGSENRIYSNDGGGSFSFTSYQVVGRGETYSLATGDIDGDNDPDLVVGNVGANTVWRNDGNGNFVDTGQSLGAQSTISANLTDVDGDGDLDLIVGGGSADPSQIWTNDGSGSFSNSGQSIASGEFSSLDVGDTDKDGDADIVVGNGGSNGVVLNDGSGTFSDSGQELGTGITLDIVLSDIDKDTDLDLISGNLGTGNGQANTVWLNSTVDNQVAFYDGRDGKAYTPPERTPGTDNNAVGRLFLEASGGGAKLSELIVTNYAGFTSDIERLSIWRSENETFESSEDTEIVSVDYAQSTSFSGLSTSIATDGTYFFIVADLAESASETYDPALQDEDAITVVQAPIFSVNGTETQSFSDAFLASGQVGLPVELTSLSAHQSAEKVTLEWETATETNNAGFYVQSQGPSQEEWDRLGFVEGAGTTSEPQTYRFEAEDLGPGTHRFRLRQVDTDGTAHLSKVVSTDIQMRKKARLSAPAPNPVTTTAQLTFAVKESKKATVTLYNTLGQRVATLYEGRPKSGEQVSLQLDTSTLSSGVYIVRLEAGGTLKTRKMNVVK